MAFYLPGKVPYGANVEAVRREVGKGAYSTEIIGYKTTGTPDPSFVEEYRKKLSAGIKTSIDIPGRYRPVYADGKLTGYEDVVAKKSIPIGAMTSTQRFQPVYIKGKLTGYEDLVKQQSISIEEKTRREQGIEAPITLKPRARTIYEQIKEAPKTIGEALERREQVKEEKPISTYEIYKGAYKEAYETRPTWKDPLKKIEYEAGLGIGKVEEWTRTKEKIWRTSAEREPDYWKKMQYKVGEAGVGFISIPIGITRFVKEAVFHPKETAIESAKFLKYLVTHPSEVGEEIGKKLWFETPATTGKIAGIYVFIGKGGTKIVKGLSKISPKYIEAPKVDLKLRIGWTRKVSLQKELSLAGQQKILTQASPKAWFKLFKAEAKVKYPLIKDVSPKRLKAGELYSYWHPGTPKGEAEALLGFAGITTKKEATIVSYIKSLIKKDKKVKLTWGKPTAEIKVARETIAGIPKGFKSEKVYAQYIMKHPGKFRIPAEVFRKGATQEYQVALAPKSVLVKEALYKVLKTKPGKIKWKTIWTELEGQKIKIVGTKLEKAFSKMEKGKAKGLTLKDMKIIEKNLQKTIKGYKYYEPTHYYPISEKIFKLKLAYYPEKYYKPIKYYKLPKYYEPKYPKYIFYEPYKPYVPKTPYAPYKLKYPKYPKYTPYMPYEPYKPYIPYKPYEPYVAYTPKIPKIPKGFLADIEGEARKKILRKRKFPYRLTYTPGFTARMLDISRKLEKNMLKKVFTGFEIRPKIRR